MITCGPTWVPIDPMRVISNRSSGEMGHALAQEFRKAGAQVTLLEGPVSHSLTSNNIVVKKFSFYAELTALIRQELKKSYDIVIHAAAVSDYRLSKPFGRKISSKLPGLNLRLTPTPKIIGMIKRWNQNVFLIGFKLEPALNEKSITAKTRDLFKKAHCDLVVANTLSKTSYTAYIIDRKRNILKQEKNRRSIANSLVKVTEQLL